MKHIEQIRQAVELQHVGCRAATWKYLPKKGEKAEGAQIDLLLDRDDDAITLFEIKFSDRAFVIDKEYAKKLVKKMDVFERQTKTKKSVFMALIAAQGLKLNVWSEDLISSVVQLEDFFK